MHHIQLFLDASYPDSILERLGDAMDGLYSAYYASHIDEDDDYSPCVLHWIIESPPPASDLNARLSIWCEIHEIALNFNQSGWKIEEIDANMDWLAENYKGFTPFAAASFFIFGSHYDGTLQDGLIPLQIDAATAFGSGEHPTTFGCIQGLCNLQKQGFTPKNVLDMGCGSGILAIAAAKLWPNAHITAIDNDPDCITVTNRHRDFNAVTDTQLQSQIGDGFAAPLAQAHKPYDLIIANILAAPLKEMAGDLTACLSQNGYALLSGLLITQAEDVTLCYTSLSLELQKQTNFEEWTTLLLKR